MAESKATARVFLVWSGEYSSAGVVGVYSTLELARAACAIPSDKNHLWIDADEGYEVDEAASLVRAGMGRWRVSFDGHGNTIGAPECEWTATGEPPSVATCKDELMTVRTDARDADHAVKIAGDERRKYLAAPAPV